MNIKEKLPDDLRWYLVSQVPEDYEGDLDDLPLKFMTGEELKNKWIVRITKKKKERGR